MPARLGIELDRINTGEMTLSEINPIREKGTHLSSIPKYDWEIFPNHKKLELNPFGDDNVRSLLAHQAIARLQKYFHQPAQSPFG